MATPEEQANASKEVQEAAKVALVGFDTNIVKTAFAEMADNQTALDAAKAGSSTAAVRLIEHAHDVALGSRDAGMDDDSIESGWAKAIKAMLPMLHADGSRFVKESESKPGNFVLSGYGQNVNSTAKGFAQYPDLDPKAAANAEGELTYGGLRDLVIARRKQDRNAEQIALADARERMAKAIKAYRDLATKGKSAERINGAAAEIEALAEELTERDELVAAAAAEELAAKAEAAEKAAEADDGAALEVVNG